MTNPTLTLRGSIRWPDPEAHVAAILPMPELLIGKTTTQQLEAERQRLEMRGFSDDEDARRQHIQNIARANLGDAEVEARALNHKLEALFPGSDFSAEAPPYEEGMDLALDEIVMEECAEVIQEVCKIRRFGMVNHITKVDNKVKLETELGQLLASIERLAEAWGLDNNVIRKAAASKFNAIEKWAPYYERNKQGD
jgi:NTP pyrophosphatase (non-canonical NTP hydrolase)